MITAITAMATTVIMEMNMQFVTTLLTMSIQNMIMKQTVKLQVTCGWKIMTKDLAMT